MVEIGTLQDEPWYAPASVEARVLAYLEQDEGCQILSSGHPATLGSGVEIVASAPSGIAGKQRLISVIGWPEVPGQMDEPVVVNGLRPEISARSWLANAMLDLLLGRGADGEVGLSLALPATAGYVRYLQRLRWLLSQAHISIYLVSQEGRVTTWAPEEPAAQNGDGHGGSGERRKLGLPGASRLHLPLLHALVEAGGAGSRTELIQIVARWFPDVRDPPPSEFGQRLSIAQSQLQSEGYTELQARGVWRITDLGRSRHAAEWREWAVAHA